MQSVGAPATRLPRQLAMEEEMNEQTITAYVTKYALTSGITKVTGSVSKNSANMLVYDLPGDLNNQGYAHGNEWHTDWKNALFHAQTMKKRKINSLQKQLTKLENLTFTEPQ